MWYTVLSDLQLGADSGSAVMTEVQRRPNTDPQTQDHTEVIHQEHRGTPLLTSTYCRPYIVPQSYRPRRPELGSLWRGGREQRDREKD